MASRQLSKIVWIIETIRKAGMISFEEINRRWVNDYVDEGKELSKRSFGKWRDGAFTNFKVIIENEMRGQYRYFISNRGVLRDNSVENWLMGTIAVSNSLMEYYTLKDRIQLEEVPSGRFHLDTILEAMRENHPVEFSYYKYQNGETHPHTIDPYALKLHRQRWYVVGRDVNENMTKVFGLDRILELNVLPSTFDMPRSFSAADFFGGSIGIFHGGYNISETIRLKVKSFQACYLKSLPLEESQKLVEETPEYSIFEYHLSQDPELTNAILSMGPSVEVLAPESLRLSIAEKAKAMLELYKSVE